LGEVEKIRIPGGKDSRVQGKKIREGFKNSRVNRRESNAEKF
jgi:hypothetical protein